MKKKRLERLIVLLRKDARNKQGVKFDLRRWAISTKRLADVISMPMSCETTACALGLAVLSGEFAKEGLGAHYYHSIIRGSHLIGGSHLHPVLDTPEGVWTDYLAAAKLFDISHFEATWLFSPDYYKMKYRQGAKGERYVANRIAKLIRDNGIKINGKRRTLFAELPVYP